MSDQTNTLYPRLGGYEAIAAVVDDFLPRLMAGAQLGRFWKHRGNDALRREKQLTIDFLCSSAGGPLYYIGRDMVTSHRGMGISTVGWQALMSHLNATLDAFKVPERERGEVRAFIESTRSDIVVEVKI